MTFLVPPIRAEGRFAPRTHWCRSRGHTAHHGRVCVLLSLDLVAVVHAGVTG